MCFNRVVCYVGNDIEYGIIALETLASKKTKIFSIVGNTANQIYKRTKKIIGTKNRILLINKSDPWNDNNFCKLLDEKTHTGIN